MHFKRYFLIQTNNYQGIIVTDGISTHAIFTYICGEMQWSSLGNGNAAVVGYNSGTGFYNHPLSGFTLIGDSISCTVNTIRRQKRQNKRQTTNIALLLPADKNLKKLLSNCIVEIEKDKILFMELFPEVLALKLEPCPCTLEQATNDIGRFVKYSDTPLCYLSGPKPTNLLKTNITLTQQCCYDPING